jgi:hypothetical protein
MSRRVPVSLMHSLLELGGFRGAHHLFGGHRDDDGGGDLPGQLLGVQVLDQLGQRPATTVGPVDVGPVRVPTLNRCPLAPLAASRPDGARPSAAMRPFAPVVARRTGAEGRVLVRAGGAQQVSSDGAVVQAPGRGLPVGQRGLLGSLAQVVTPGCGHRLQHLAQRLRCWGRQRRRQLRGAIAQVTHGHRRQPVGPTLLIHQLRLEVIGDLSRGLLRSSQRDLRRPIQPARVQPASIAPGPTRPAPGPPPSDRLGQLAMVLAMIPAFERDLTSLERLPRAVQPIRQRRRQHDIPSRRAPPAGRAATHADVDECPHRDAPAADLRQRPTPTAPPPPGADPVGLVDVRRRDHHATSRADTWAWIRSNVACTSEVASPTTLGVTRSSLCTPPTATAPPAAGADGSTEAADAADETPPDGIPPPGFGSRAASDRGFPTSGLAVLAVDGPWARLAQGGATLEEFVVGRG